MTIEVVECDARAQANGRDELAGEAVGNFWLDEERMLLRALTEAAIQDSKLRVLETKICLSLQVATIVFFSVILTTALLFRPALLTPTTIGLLIAIVMFALRRRVIVGSLAASLHRSS